MTTGNRELALVDKWLCEGIENNLKIHAKAV